MDIPRIQRHKAPSTKPPASSSARKPPDAGRTRKRKVLWSAEQKKVLVDEVCGAGSVLFSKLANGCQNEQKHQIWEHIAEMISMAGRFTIDAKQARRRWEQLKSNVKVRVEVSPNEVQLLTPLEQKIFSAINAGVSANAGGALPDQPRNKAMSHDDAILNIMGAFDAPGFEPKMEIEDPEISYHEEEQSGAFADSSGIFSIPVESTEETAPGCSSLIRNTLANGLNRIHPHSYHDAIPAIEMMDERTTSFVDDQHSSLIGDHRDHLNNSPEVFAGSQVLCVDPQRPCERVTFAVNGDVENSSTPPVHYNSTTPVRSSTVYCSNPQDLSFHSNSIRPSTQNRHITQQHSNSNHSSDLEIGSKSTADRQFLLNEGISDIELERLAIERERLSVEQSRLEVERERLTVERQMCMSLNSIATVAQAYFQTLNDSKNV